MSWGDVSTGPAGSPPKSCGPRMVCLLCSCWSEPSRTFPPPERGSRLSPLCGRVGRGRTIRVQDVAAARPPHAVVTLDVVESLCQMRRAMRRTGQERMQRDRQHARLVRALAIERVEGIDDIG